MRGRPWQVVAASSAALVITSGFGRFSYGLLLPAMERSTLGSYGRAGWLGTASLAAYLAGVAAVTVLAGRVSATALARGGLAATAAGLGLLALAPSYLVLVVAMVVVGVGTAAVWLPVTGLVAAVVAPARRGIVMGFTVAGSGLGVVIAVVIATLVGQRFGPTSWRAAWAVEAVLGVAVLGLVVAAIPPRPTEALRRRSGPGALRLLRDRGAALVTYGAFGLGYAVYTTFLVAGLERSGGLSPGLAGAAFALLGATAAAGGVALGNLSDRVGRRATLLASQAGLAVCSLVLPSGSRLVAFASAGAFGVLMSGVGATVVAHLSDAIAPEEVPGAFGVLTLAFGAAQCVGPPLGGFLVDSTGGFRAAFVLAAGAFVVAGLGAWRLRGAPAGSGRLIGAVQTAIDVQREI